MIDGKRSVKCGENTQGYHRRNALQTYHDPLPGQIQHMARIVRLDAVCGLLTEMAIRDLLTPGDNHRDIRSLGHQAKQSKVRRGEVDHVYPAPSFPLLSHTPPLL